MQSRLFFIALLLSMVLLTSNSLLARDNTMEFGVGLQMGYYFPELSDHVGKDYYMESTDKAIYGLNVTFGFTPHFWSQLLVEYYPGDMEYDIHTSFTEMVIDERGREVPVDYTLNYDAEADLKHGIKTYATTFGREKAVKISFLIFVVSGIFGIFLFLQSILSPIFLIIFLFLFVYTLFYPFKLLKSIKGGIKEQVIIVGRKFYDYFLFTYVIIFFDIIIQVLILNYI